MAATSTFAAAASELAAKVRAWLGQRSLDDAPARYELETTAVTSDGFTLVLRAVYTVGPKNPVEEPLLLRGNNNKLPVSKKKAPRHVSKLLQGHVSALAAGMTTEQVLGVERSTSRFVKEDVDRVNGDSVGLFVVYSARVEKLGVQVPCNKVVVAEVGPTAEMAVHSTHIRTKKAKLEVEVSKNPGKGAVTVAVTATHPANKKNQLADDPDDKSIINLAAGGGVQIYLDLDGKKSLRFMITTSVELDHDPLGENNQTAAANNL